MSQVSFPVVLLLAFRKRERSAALRTRDFKVWHRGFSMRAESRTPTLFALRSAGVAFLSTTGCGAKALFLKHYAESLRRPDRLVGLSLLQRMGVFKSFMETVWVGSRQNQTVAKSLHEFSVMWLGHHTHSVGG